MSHCSSFRFIIRGGRTPVKLKILPDVSATTVEAVLGRMVRDGAVRKIDSGRGTRYIKS